MAPGRVRSFFLRRFASLVSLSCLVFAAALVATVVHGAAPHDVGTVFFVAKSENRNQVHYGIHLDAACAPEGASPVFAYWRMLERGPLATEPLLSREVRAYGVRDQRVLTGGRIEIRLNALPQRPIVIESAARGDTCETSASTTIDGVPASLANVYAQLRWPVGVEYLMLSGRARGDGRAVRERVAD